MEQKPLIKIDSETLERLPVCQFGGQIVVIDSDAGLHEACDYLLSQRVIGFDTETRPSFTAGVIHKVALLQLSAADRCYLMRLCSMRMDKAIIKVLESPGVLKVGADIRNDLRALQALRHFRPGGFLDLQSVIRKHGIDELSLRKMAAAVLGMKVSKAQRLSNWQAASLTPAQQLYAATDAWAALEIYKKLYDE